MNQEIWVPNTILSHAQLKLKKFSPKIYQKTTYKNYELNLLKENIRENALIFIFIILFSYKIKSNRVIVIQIITIIFNFYNNIILNKYLINKNNNKYQMKRYYLELYHDPNFNNTLIKKENDNEEAETEEKLIIDTSFANTMDEKNYNKTYLEYVNEDIIKYSNEIINKKRI